jgi:hypothetical protein
MAATNKIMVMRPETVARTAPGLDHSPLLSCCHRRLTNIILNFCHLCSRRWQPSSNPQGCFGRIRPSWLRLRTRRERGTAPTLGLSRTRQRASSLERLSWVGRPVGQRRGQTPTISRDPSSCSSTWPTSGERTPRDAVNPSPQFRGLSKSKAR